MRDYTLVNPKAKDIRARKKREIINGIIALILMADVACVIAGAAYFETTDDAKGILIAMAALAVQVVLAILINIREEKRE